MTIGPTADGRLVNARAAVLRRIRRRRRATTGLAVGVVLALGGSGVGAALAVQQMSARDVARSVICFAHDDLGSLSGTSVTADESGPLDKRAACESTWNSGIAVAAANGGHWPDVDPNVPGNYPIPPLAFCRMANGETAGLPVEAPATTAAQACARVGLPVDTSVSS